MNWGKGIIIIIIIFRKKPNMVEDGLKHHEYLQQEITGDLVAMAQTLKNNTLAFSDILKKDEKVIIKLYYSF